jgi:hypothetical protein
MKVYVFIEIPGRSYSKLKNTAECYAIKPQMNLKTSKWSQSESEDLQT